MPEIFELDGEEIKVAKSKYEGLEDDLIGVDESTDREKT